MTLRTPSLQYRRTCPPCYSAHRPAKILLLPLTTLSFFYSPHDCISFTALASLGILFPSSSKGLCARRNRRSWTTHLYCGVFSNVLKSAPSPLYQYLSADEIRLLSCKIADSTLFWLLETSERRTAPRYNALSYCWGNSVKQSPIVCNGHSIKVTSSVAGALQMIAHSHEQADMRFWVDLLCLNREDEHEKEVRNA